uniref:Membrane protein n=1 Tax=Thermogemmatispora argillosa TaxID=2045280 RepID=A0A455SYJ0_9CHLR|nr:membrane protein [Thermogemmatispora argillosa]
MGMGLFLARLLSALLCGLVIGLERQYRRRAAGLRTSALVATGSALFVLASTQLPGGNRLAAQVVSGVGFLCAGVILRDGLAVRGLNTAGTLWCVAATGVLAATGQLSLAMLSALMIVATHVTLRPVALMIDRWTRHALEQPGTCYLLQVLAAEDAASHARALLWQALQSEPVLLQDFRCQPGPEPGLLRLQVKLCLAERNDRLLERVSLRLSLETAIIGVTWALATGEDRTGPEPEKPGEGQQSAKGVVSSSP